MSMGYYKYFFSTLFWVLACSFCNPSFYNQVNAHPFYISVTEINHNPKEKTLELSCKMFADDFEKVINRNYKLQLDIGSPKNKTTYDPLISAYFSTHLRMSADGKILKINYVGFEKEKESVYCYFQVGNLPYLKNLEITNSILHDLNENQINIIHVMVLGKRQSTKLDYPAKNARFSF
ncbi:MAG: hypothetical protein NVS9B7_25820 [Flavisolibacter sp.]